MVYFIRDIHIYKIKLNTPKLHQYRHRSCRKTLKLAVSAPFRLTMLIIAVIILVLWLFYRYLKKPSQVNFTPRKTSTEEPKQASHQCRFKRKPDWVRTEVIRLKALMPSNGCRMLANQFNRLHMDTREETVSKSYVANVIKR